MKMPLLSLILGSHCLLAFQAYADLNPYDGVYQRSLRDANSSPNTRLRDGFADSHDSHPACGHGRGAVITVVGGVFHYRGVSNADIILVDIQAPIRADGTFEGHGQIRTEGPFLGSLVRNISGRFDYDQQTKSVVMSADVVDASGYCKWTYRLKKLPSDQPPTDAGAQQPLH
jgi:hypothetical protein